jgi:MoaA/NifB/PqqE/SkfB family radical SAM enzyme
MAQIAGPTGDYRVVQIHPLLKCNLRCLHCYSSSSPTQLPTLPLERVCSAVDLLYAEGYNSVGISGGEPLLYAQLPKLLQHIRDLAMIATVTTNGMLVDDRLAAVLREATKLVAVSVDGPPESHNRMRAHPQAFKRMTEGVARLKHAGVPFGFIFTLTLCNLHELNWLAEFAVAQGARLLQVHPLEEVGRATGQFSGCAPDALELARAFVEVARLQKEYAGSLTIQYDVADLELLCAKPECGYAVEPFVACETKDAVAIPLADLIAPIIIEADGAIVPLQYNFSRFYQIGNINADGVSAQIRTWKQSNYHQFLALCRSVYDRLLQPGATEYPFVNWYGEMLQASQAVQFKPAADTGSISYFRLPVATNAPRPISANTLADRNSLRV